jgi:hypothetical protein
MDNVYKKRNINDLAATFGNPQALEQQRQQKLAQMAALNRLQQTPESNYDDSRANSEFEHEEPVVRDPLYLSRLSNEDMDAKLKRERLKQALQNRNQDMGEDRVPSLEEQEAMRRAQMGE